MFNSVPRVLVFVDGDVDVDLTSDEWDETIVKTLEEFWSPQNDLSNDAGFEVLTASGVLDLDGYMIDHSFPDILDVVQDREENLLVTTIENGLIRASFDARYPPDVDDATRELFKFDTIAARIQLESNLY